MNKGKILFLNGVTSTGKTSIAHAIQLKSDEHYYYVSNDLFQQMVGDKYLQEDFWKYLSDAIIMMYHTARLFSEHGKNVIIDGMLLDMPEIKPHNEKIINIFTGYPLYIIDVFCPLEICRQRNIERGDRGVDQSVWQSEAMSKDISYNFSVNTYLNTTDECADLIIKKLSL